MLSSVTKEMKTKTKTKKKGRNKKKKERKQTKRGVIKCAGITKHVAHRSPSQYHTRNTRKFFLKINELQMI